MRDGRAEVVKALAVRAWGLDSPLSTGVWHRLGHNLVPSDLMVATRVCPDAAGGGRVVAFGVGDLEQSQLCGGAGARKARGSRRSGRLPRELGAARGGPVQAQRLHAPLMHGVRSQRDGARPADASPRDLEPGRGAGWPACRGR
jgi:hypothetical protein